MNRTYFLLCLVLGTYAASSEVLKERGVIPINPAEISNFRLERDAGTSRYFVLVGTKDGGLKIYDAIQQLRFERGGIKGFVYWDTTFLHDGAMFFLEKQELFRLNLDQFDLSKVSTKTLVEDDYTSFRAFTAGTGDILIAENAAAIHIYRFPTLELIGEVKRGQPVRRLLTRFLQGIVIYQMRENQLAGFDLGTKINKWELDLGTRKAKYLGVSLGTIPNMATYVAANERDSEVYVATLLGDLYRLDPRNGNIVKRAASFGGEANNAGLLTQMYFRDMDGDGTDEIVAPSVDDNIYCISTSDFAVRWSHDTGNENQMPLAFYDITGDGIPEVFGVSDYDLKLSILDGRNGELVKDFSLEKGEKKFNQTFVQVGDIDGNGYLDIVTQRDSHTLMMLELEFPLPTSKLVR